MIGYRPCGACVELVPADTGCGHWKPGQRAEPDRKSRSPAAKNAKRDRDRERSRLRRAQEREAVEAIRRTTGEA